MSKIQLVAFDFDGTLADSVDLCLTVFDRVFAAFLGKNVPTREEIFREFGRNEPGILKCYIPDRAQEAEALFYKLHRELHPKMCPTLLPGCRELLDALQARGVKLALVTGRSPETCRISLEYLHIKECFCAIETGAPERTAKAEQLKSLQNRYRLQADELVYVGDVATDATASQAAGITCLSAAWAKSARIKELEKVNPGKLFFSPEALQEYLFQQL